MRDRHARDRRNHIGMRPVLQERIINPECRAPAGPRKRPVPIASAPLNRPMPGLGLDDIKLIAAAHDMIDLVRASTEPDSDIRQYGIPGFG